MFCDNCLQRDVSLGPSQCHAAAIPCPSAAARKTHPSGPGSWKFPVPRLGTPRSHPNPHLGNWAKGATQTPHSTQLTQLPYRGSTNNVQSHLSHLVTVWRNHSRPPLKLKQIVPLDCLLVGSLCKSNTPKSIYIRSIHVKLPSIPAKSSYVERLLKAFSSPVFFALCHLLMTSRSSGRTQRLQFSGSKSSCAMSAKELLQPSNHRTKSTIFHRYHRHRLGNK